jgi:hypothetical protein
MQNARPPVCKSLLPQQIRHEARQTAAGLPLSNIAILSGPAARFDLATVLDGAAK